MTDQRFLILTFALIGSSALSACHGVSSSSEGAVSTAATSATTPASDADDPIAATPVPNAVPEAGQGRSQKAIPSAPGNFHLTGNNAGTVSVAWQDNSNDETSFRLQWRKLSAEAWDASPSLAPNTTSYTLPALDTGTYLIRVFSHNSSGPAFAEPLRLNVIAGSSPAPAPSGGGQPAATPPVAPVPGAARTVAAADAVSLEWDAAENAQGYRVQWRGPDWGGWGNSGLLSASTRSYRIGGLWAGPYQVRVQAFNGDGANVSTSPESTVTVGGSPPTNDTAVSAATNTPPAAPASTGSAGQAQRVSLTQSSPEAPAGGSVQSAVDDMGGRGDYALLNVMEAGWASGNAYVIMGNQPYTKHAPSYWQNECGHSSPACNRDFYTEGSWNFAVPWIVIFEGRDNAAFNTRIQMRNLRLHVKYKGQGWRLVDDSGDRMEGYNCGQNTNYLGCTGNVDRRNEASGGVSIRPTANANFHGYGSLRSIEGWNLEAVHVSLQARMVPNGDNDDRRAARYMIQTGADYYPIGRSLDRYVPAAALSRTKAVGSDWQAFTMTTFSDVGIQEPGGGISRAAFVANPPPMQ